MRGARFVAALVACLATTASLVAQAPARPPLGAAEIDAIATLLQLEDTRRFDEAAFSRHLGSRHPEVRRRAVVALARIRDTASRPLLVSARRDAEPQVVVSVAFAAGQLKDAEAIPWLAEVMRGEDVALAREAARSLGKMTGLPGQTGPAAEIAAARDALATYLASAPATADAAPVVGEALLAIGRFTTRGDLAPVLRWMTTRDVEVRWRAAWALFRPRDPAAVPYLLTLSRDRSADVRFWAVRGLVPPTAPARAGGAAPSAQAGAESARFDRAATSARLREAVRDDDRRVRTEALRALALHDDDASFAVVLAALDDPDTWLSVSAAENMTRYPTRADAIVPALIRATATSRPLALRAVAIDPLSRLAPDAAIEPAAMLAQSATGVARNAGVQALQRAGDAGRARLATLGIEVPAGGRGRGAAEPPAPRPIADYRGLVERWIVPDYNGAPKPRAIWETAKGAIELELNPGDAPLGVEHFLQLTESGDIVGTEFSRVVPNFVDQQQTIRNARRLRDEVNLHGLLRGTLSWASSGLDTGRPGYTLASTPQPHNEGNFTALGRVVAGMDVVDRIEWGDAILAARMR